MGSILSLAFLPAISLLSGIASIQIDPKSNKKWVLILIMIASATGSVVLGASDNKDKANQEQVISSVRDLSTKIAATTQKTDSTVANISSELSSFGLSPQAVNVVRQALKADTARQALVGKVAEANRQNSPPTITYYPKDVDGPMVVKALQEGGFRVTLAVGNLHNAALTTNAVWSGEPVGLEQAKFVALTLVRAGVGIRYIGRVEGRSKNENVIEVGSSAEHQKDPVLSVDQIEQLQSFMRPESSFR
jgi:outer membrane murein-binding lipoprotein Lpp